MLHESNLEKDINITDTDITFETILQEKYIPQKYIGDIKKANVLIIPNEGFRDNEGYFFPECTSEFYMFLKNHEEIETEICIDNDEFQKIELHADIIYVATLIVQYEVLPVVTSVIASYLYDKINSMNKEKKDSNASVHIIVEKNGKSKKIDYEGSIDNFEEAMKTLEQTIFK
ncbi:hypothetical protein AALH30_04185 [Blautia pseudococcoides]|uniref:hypothetical protein n=1 Tax=Blautia pseudococcoides TaxID=1796616 RepID=UPI003517F089